VAHELDYGESKRIRSIRGACNSFVIHLGHLLLALSGLFNKIKGEERIYICIYIYIYVSENPGKTRNTRLMVSSGGEKGACNVSYGFSPFGTSLRSSFRENR